METKQSSSAAGTLGIPQGELVLRITGNSAQPETVRVRSPKCSIGSADACTIRLNAAGVQAVHCIILRGPTETAVRRWADELWLNGKSFGDATLQVGDVLSFANIRIEVVSDSRSESTDLHRQIAASESKVDQLSEHTRVLNERIRQLEGNSPAQLSESAQGEILVRLARLQDEKQDLERRIAAQSVRHLEERRQWTSDLERLQSHVAKASEFDSVLADANRQNDALNSELENLKQQLERSCVDFEAERVALREQATTQADSKCEQQLADLETRQSEFEANVQQFQMEQESSQQELDQRTQEQEERAHDLQERALQLDKTACELEERSAVLDQRSSETECNETSVASLYDELEQVQDPESVSDVNFPSQLKLSDSTLMNIGESVVQDESSDDLQDPIDESQFNETEQDDSLEPVSDNYEAEFVDASDDANFASEEDSFDEIQAEIDNLIDEESQHDKSPSNDDLMRYANQVANEVSDQVIDQQPEPELPKAETPDNLISDGLESDSHGASLSDSFIDAFAEPTAESPIHTDEAVDVSAIDEDDVPADVSNAAEAEIAELFADAMADDSTSKSRTAQESHDLEPDADHVDSSELRSSPFATETDEEYARSCAHSPFDSAPSELVDSQEPSLDAESVEDEMLSRLQAMMSSETPESGAEATIADAGDNHRAEPDAPVRDAESLLSELQAMSALDEPRIAEDFGQSNEELLTAVESTQENIQQPPAELALDSYAEEAAPTTPDELTFGTVEREPNGQLESAALLEQNGMASGLDDEPMAANDSQYSTEPTAPIPATLASAGNVEDDSIEDYMQQLLQRVSNGTNIPHDLPPGQQVPSEQIDSFNDEVTAPVEAPKPQRVPTRPSLPLDSLTKMRELANESTRSAIKSHADSSSRANAFSNLCFLGISGLAAAICFVLSEGTSIIWLAPGVVSLGAVVFFGYRMTGLGQQRGLVNGIRNASARNDSSNADSSEFPVGMAPQDQADPNQPQQSFGFDPNMSTPLGQEPGYGQRAVDQAAQPTYNPLSQLNAQPQSQSEFPQMGQQPFAPVPGPNTAPGVAYSQQPAVGQMTYNPQAMVQDPNQMGFQQPPPGVPMAENQQPSPQPLPQQPIAGFEPTPQQPPPSFQS